jgi:2-polyprenyl-6-methoxyphenol hydroxylase-like FAD-dependent oxidoreductase
VSCPSGRSDPLSGFTFGWTKRRLRPWRTFVCSGPWRASSVAGQRTAWFQPLNLKGDFLVSQFAFCQMQLVPMLQRGHFYGDLWRHLYDAFPGEVRFGVDVTGVLDPDSKSPSLIVDGETVGPFDLVVGADGGASTIRPVVVSNPEPTYAGYNVWRGLCPRVGKPSLCGPLSRCLCVVLLRKEYANRWNRTNSDYESDVSNNTPRVVASSSAPSVVVVVVVV